MFGDKEKYLNKLKTYTISQQNKNKVLNEGFLQRIHKTFI